MTENQGYPKGYFYTTGISKRDWFAAKAMQGILANPDVDVDGANNLTNGNIARVAYQYADSMIDEGKK